MPPKITPPAQSQNAPNLPGRAQSRLGLFECMAGLVLTLLAIVLHISFLNHAGGLWRDEAVSINVAQQPSLAQVWQTYWYDSFPPLYHFLLRLWAGLGGAANDHWLRISGLIVGLALLGVLWLNGRFLRYGAPLIALSLFALLHTTIRTTDAIRAYGLGTVFIVLAFGLVWRVIEQTSLQRITVAALLTALSVQTLYQNAALVFGICAAGMFVCFRRRDWNRLLVIAGIGSFAGLSLLIHLPSLGRLRDVSPLMSQGTSFLHLARVCSEAMGGGNWIILMAWVLFGGGILFILIRGRAEAPSQESPPRDLAIFASVAMLVGGSAFFLWLKVLGLPSQFWYYVPVLGLTAVGFDTVWGSQSLAGASRMARLAFLSALAVISLVASWPIIKQRQTNMDVIATALEKSAREGDLILVQPWFLGASFERYYHGKAPWITIPPLADQKLHRLDLFRKQMLAPNPLAPVRDGISATLTSNHQVWLVGAAQPLSPNQVPPEIEPAPKSRWGWNHDAYGVIWSLQIIHFLQSHGVEATRMPDPTGQPVNPFENTPVITISGWH